MTEITRNLSKDVTRLQDIGMSLEKEEQNVKAVESLGNTAAQLSKEVSWKEMHESRKSYKINLTHDLHRSYSANIVQLLACLLAWIQKSFLFVTQSVGTTNFNANY